MSPLGSHSVPAPAPSRGAADRLGAVGVAMAVLAVMETVLGLWMVLAPSSFFDVVGPFGARNDHYIRDMASWELALAVGAALAVRHVRWRVPVLALATTHFALHALNHAVDVGQSDPSWVGPADLLSLA